MSCANPFSPARANIFAIFYWQRIGIAEGVQDILLSGRDAEFPQPLLSNSHIAGLFYVHPS